MAIGSTDLSKLRGPMHVVRPVINYFPAETVVQGTVSFTPVIYPIGQVSVTWDDSGWNNIEVGQLVVIRTAGGTRVTYGVVRKTATSNTLYIDGKSRGDSGSAVRQEVAIETGQRITVYTYQPLWTLLSRILNGQFLKKFDIPYDGSGSAPPPVLNIGQWRQVYASDLTGLGTLSFSTSGSYGWLNHTISSIQWELPGSAVITSGGLTQSDVTFTLPQGFHIVRCTIQDNVGATTSGYRPVWVNGTSFPALSDQWGYSIDSDSQDRKGRNMSLTLLGDFDEDLFVPGNAFHFKEYDYFSGTQLSAGIGIDNFVGFGGEQSDTMERGLGKKGTAFEISGPWAWMEKIPMVSQAIVESASPADWTDVSAGLGTPDFITWYVLHHHTTYLSMFDYMPLSTGVTPPAVPRKQNWGLNGSVVSEYVSAGTNVIAGNAGCLSDGTMYLRRDPNVEEIAYRDAIDEVMTITVDEDNDIFDLRAPIEFPYSFFNQTGQIRCFALMFNGSDTTAFASIAPGYTQMQAAGSSDEDSFMVNPDPGVAEGDPSYEPSGQDAINRFCGHVLAKTNNPTPELTLPINRNIDVFEPAKMVWGRLSVPAEWNPKNKAINSRFVLVSIDRAWEEATGGAFIKTINLTVSLETFGQPGETFLLDKAGGSKYPPVKPPEVLNEEEDFEAVFGAFLLAFDDEWRLVRTSNGVNWINVSEVALQGRVQDVALDYYSDFVSSGFIEGGLGAWVVTADDTAGGGSYDTVRIYYTYDILAPTVDFVEQYTTTRNSDITGQVRIRTDYQNDGYIAINATDERGTLILRSFDLGENWIANQAGDDALSASTPLLSAVDMAINNGVMVTSGYDDGIDKWILYNTDTDTGTIDPVANSPESDIPWPSIVEDTVNSLYYATKINYTSSSTSGRFYFLTNNQGYSGIGDIVVKKEEPIASPSASVDEVNLTFSATINGTEVDAGVNNGPYWLTDESVSITSPFPMTELDGVFWSRSGLVPGDILGAVLDINVSGISSIAKVTYSYATFPQTSTGALTHVIELYDADGVLIDFFSRAGSTTSAGSCVEAQFSYHTIDSSSVIGGSCVTQQFLLSSTPDVSRIRIRILDNQNTTTGIMLTEAHVYFDDYEFEVPTHYRISNITSGTPTFTDITRIDSELGLIVPKNPYALSVDAIDSNNLAAILKGGGNIARLSTSSSKGSSWSDINDNISPYYGVKSLGDIALLFGDNRLDNSLDAMVTFESLKGDFDSAIGTTGTFRGIIAII